MGKRLFLSVSLKLLDKPRRKKRKGIQKFGRYKIFSTQFLTGETRSKARRQTSSFSRGGFLCRKHDVYDRFSRTSISQATTLKRAKERERDTPAVYLRVDIAKTRGTVYIRRYRSQDVVATASNTRESGIARYFRRNHAGNGQLLFTVNRYYVPETTNIYIYIYIQHHVRP